MQIRELHSFDVDYAAAREIQIELAKNLNLSGGPKPGDLKTVAGCDVAFSRKENLAFGAVVVLSYPELEILRSETGVAPPRFPYVPGFLSFREIEVLLPLFERIERPDLLLVDGQGIAHPRGLGLASHLALFLDIPAVGCAKSRLVGEAPEPGREKGSRSSLTYKNKPVGTLLRTRTDVKPMYISPGNGVSIRKAADLALACTDKYKMPEPTRQADLLAGRFKREFLEGDK